jgi:hypothetical protein
MNMPTPFATEAQAPAATNSHPFAAAEAQAAAPTADNATKAPRKKSRRLSMEEQQYVLINYKDKNPATIAQELTLQASQAGLTAKDGSALPSVTSAQVANTVRSARTKVEAKIAVATEAGDQATVTALTAKLEEALPKRSFRGTGGGNSGPRTNSLDSLVDTLFTV